MKATRVAWSAALALVALCVACIALSVPRIEGELSLRAEAALSRLGIAAEGISVRGRDVRVAGAVVSPALATRVEAALEGIAGVRSVDVWTRSGEVVEAGTTAVEVTVTGDSLWLEGVLPDAEARQRLLGGGGFPPARLAFRDGIRIVAGADSAPWLGEVRAALESLSGAAEAWSLSVSGGEGVLTGVVADEEEEARIREAVAAVAGSVQLMLDLRIRPASAEEELQSGLDHLTWGRRVSFVTGSAGITPEGRLILDEVGFLLRQYPEPRVVIAGHTDAQGDATANRNLSVRRARAVLDYLVSRGLDRDRFEVTGFGGTRPITHDSTPEGREANRRIEFMVDRRG